MLTKHYEIVGLSEYSICLNIWSNIMLFDINLGLDLEILKTNEYAYFSAYKSYGNYNIPEKKSMYTHENNYIKCPILYKTNSLHSYMHKSFTLPLPQSLTSSTKLVAENIALKMFSWLHGPHYCEATPQVKIAYHLHSDITAKFIVRVYTQQYSKF